MNQDHNEDIHDAIKKAENDRYGIDGNAPHFDMYHFFSRKDVIFAALFILILLIVIVLLGLGPLTA